MDGGVWRHLCDESVQFPPSGINMKGALCKLKLVRGRFSHVGEGEKEKGKKEESPLEEDKSEGRKTKIHYFQKSPEKDCATCISGDAAAKSTRDGIFSKPLCQILKPAGQFAYCGFVTEVLKILFSDSAQDRDFAEVTLKRFLSHLALPTSTCCVMELTLSGGPAPEGWTSYIALFKEEDSLAKNFSLLVQDLVLFAVQNGNYDARIRVLITHCACLLNVSPDLVEMFEEAVLEFLTEKKVLLSAEHEDQRELKFRNTKIKRYAVIGLATIGGGALLGLTGGFAAPLIGAGLGTFIGAGGVAALSSTAGMAVIGSLFGAAGAGLTGYKMRKRVGEVEEFAFELLTQGTSLHITIAVCGWLREEHPQSFTKPWKCLLHSREQYCLRYESKYLLELGKAMDLLLQFALSMAVQESLKYTILASIISAITWPASLLTLAAVIDNPWGVCIRRSAEAGKQLAQVLLQRHHGRRPVTLIGFSLGARVIFYCLQDLARKEGSDGIVQDAIFMGAPVPGYASYWRKFGGVVCGRIINGYSQSDWLLRFLYRTSSASLRIAGLEPVNWKDRRMFNYDLSDIVNGHSDYEEKLEIILKRFGIRTTSPFGSSESLERRSTSSLPEHNPMSWKSLVSDLRRSVSDNEIFLSTSSAEFYSSEEGATGLPSETPVKCPEKRRFSYNV